MAAVIEAAQPSAHVFPLAALPLFAEKSHLGHHAATSTLRPGSTIAISSTATGFPGCVYDSGTWSCCSSKERDSETGLDFFNARYLSSAQGRFTSADPSNLSVDFWLPQTWNRYSYGLNNPLKVVDRNGLWPTYIHNEIIREAFPGMSKDQLQTLITASHDTDYVNKVQVDGHTYGPQDPEASFVHSMSNGWDTMGEPYASQRNAAAFIQSNEQSAQQQQAAWIASGHTGIAPGALTAFGNALHTIEDGTSPAHKGFQPWYGAWPGPALGHVLRESVIFSWQKQNSVDAARQAFLQTFGDLLPSWQSALLFGFPQTVPDVHSKICFQQEDGPPICQ